MCTAPTIQAPSIWPQPTLVTRRHQRGTRAPAGSRFGSSKLAPLISAFPGELGAQVTNLTRPPRPNSVPLTPKRPRCGAPEPLPGRCRAALIPSNELRPQAWTRTPSPSAWPSTSPPTPAAPHLLDAADAPAPPSSASTMPSTPRDANPPHPQAPATRRCPLQASIAAQSPCMRRLRERACRLRSWSRPLAQHTSRPVARRINKARIGPTNSPTNSRNILIGSSARRHEDRPRRAFISPCALPVIGGSSRGNLPAHNPTSAAQSILGRRRERQEPDETREIVRRAGMAVGLVVRVPYTDPHFRSDVRDRDRLGHRPC